MLIRKVVDHIKRIEYYGKLNWWNFYRNNLLKKRISNDDLNFLKTAQKNQAKKFWEKYTNKYNVDFCVFYSSKNEKFDIRYIPDNLYYTYIDKYFNNSKLSYGIDDKSYYSKLFPNLLQPLTPIRRINGYYYDFNYIIFTRF